MPADVDSEFMNRAVALARRGCGHTRPNPPVGAVIVKNGKIVGEGWHRRAGGDHAEVAAIKNALRLAGSGGTERTGGTASRIFDGSTLYVTLEPCSKPGRVGACTDAIARAGIPKVVYAVPDPNPANRGRAKRVLAKAGVRCERLAAGECAKAAQRLIAPFAKHVTTGMPYVTVKIAMSLDGKTCDDRGDAKWISSALSRRRTGSMRAMVDAIMVGAETVRKDDPSLLCHQKRNDDLIRVVISKSGRLPGNAQVFADGAPNRTLVFDDARRALEELGKAGVMHVYCEGGLKLAASLAADGLVDEWMLITAPVVIGSLPVSKAVRMRLAGCGFSDRRAGDREGLYLRA